MYPSLGLFLGEVIWSEGDDDAGGGDFQILMNGFLDEQLLPFPIHQLLPPLPFDLLSFH